MELALHPIAVVTTTRTGRGLVTARHVRAGETLLVSEPAAMSVHRKHLSLVCSACARFRARSALQTRCTCGTYYCSDACCAADAPLHAPHCAALLSLSRDRALKKEEASLVRLLFSALARAGTLRPNAPTLDDTMTLMADHAAVKGFKRRRRQRIAAARAFVALQPPLRADHAAAAEEGCELERQLLRSPIFRSVRAVEAILARGPLNEFGLCDIDGEAAGCGFYPSAAMANHSCVPTAAVRLERSSLVFIALTDLCAGTEVTFSYANLRGDGGVDRAENLELSWNFVCACERCRLAPGPSAARSRVDAFDALHVCVCGNVSHLPRGACRCGQFNALPDAVGAAALLVH